ncbi:MAG: hypothetical protein ABWY48_11065 [Pseudoxanthomonas sp.]
MYIGDPCVEWRPADLMGSHVGSTTGSELDSVLQAHVDRLWVSCVNCAISERQETWDRGLPTLRELAGDGYCCPAMEDAVQDIGFRLASILSTRCRRASMARAWVDGVELPSEGIDSSAIEKRLQAWGCWRPIYSHWRRAGTPARNPQDGG